MGKGCLCCQILPSVKLQGDTATTNSSIATENAVASTYQTHTQPILVLVGDAGHSYVFLQSDLQTHLEVCTIVAT